MIRRRDLLVAGGALALAGTADPEPSLAALARAKGIRFGSCIGGGNFADPAYRALNAAQCALIVPEGEMKWMATRPDAQRFDFRAADAIVAWAGANGLGVRGHTLLWHYERWMPKWLVEHDFGSNPRAEAERLLTTHVRTVAGRYAPAVDSFDVANEGIDPDTGLLRETSLSRAMGGAQPTLDLAFHAARAAAPRAQLVYNDFMNWQKDSAVHRAAVLKLLRGFRQRGVPVDALGVQSHLGSKFSDTPSGLGDLDETGWRRFLDEVTAMSFDLLVTEMDVHDNPLPGDPTIRDAAVAAHARAYIDVMLSYRRCRTVMCWGLSDRYSWLQPLRPRADDLPKRPCPYDAEFRAKPFRAAIAGAIQAARRDRG